MQLQVSKIARWLAYLTVALLATACAVGVVKIDYQNLQAGDAKSAQVVLKMHTGDLNIQGGAQDLLNAKFTSDVPGWKPQVSYTVNNGTGLLTIQQPGSPSYVLGQTQYQWDLNLKKDLPIDLQAHTDSGNMDLQLGEMELSSLKASDLNGGLTLNMPGDYQLSNFTVNTSQGDLNASLSGSFTMPDLNLLASDGKLNAAFTGKFNLPILNLQNVNGDIQVDLTAQWLEDARVNVGSRSGDITLKLPKDVGVSVYASTNSGQINAPGLTMQGEHYVNGAYGKSPVTLQIAVAVVNGNIDLQLAQ